MDNENKSPRNKNRLYSMIGIASGIAIGSAIGIATHNEGIGIALCAAFSVPFSMMFVQKRKKN